MSCAEVAVSCAGVAVSCAEVAVSCAEVAVSCAEVAVSWMREILCTFVENLSYNSRERELKYPLRIALCKENPHYLTNDVDPFQSFATMKFSES